MGLLSKDIETLDDLFVHTLQDIYYAEKQILKALPKMIGKVTDSELGDALSEHLEQTKTHVQRLEQVFEMYGTEVKAVDCPAIDGIIKEANEIVGDIGDKSVLDAAIVAAAQAVEHYEITRYGTLKRWAEVLGLKDAAKLLDETLEEESNTDEALTELADASANEMAKAA